jgi:hypothetical protein
MVLGRKHGEGRIVQTVPQMVRAKKAGIGRRTPQHLDHLPRHRPGSHAGLIRPPSRVIATSDVTV